ncbi:hypothetical protein [Pedobacter sp.]
MEQEEKLLEYLASLGFTGEKLESDLRENMKTGELSFRISHTLKFGSETMNYELYFGKIHQFESYQLEKFRATHVDYMGIEHVKKSGIDTQELEAQMKKIDWQGYFAQRPADGNLSSEMAQVMAQLDRLASLGDQQLLDIRNKLMFRYWPEEAFGSELWLLRENYTNSRDFSAGEYGICNASLAYYIVSDRLGNLYEDLSRMRLEDVIKTDLYNDLSDKLSNNPDEFELGYPINTADGFYELLIPIRKENEWHKVEHYHLEMTPHLDIIHGVFNSVDSRELEGIMKDINWNRDSELFTFHENSEPKSNAKVEAVEEKMFRLALDPKGIHIADQLQTKYWAGATFFEDTIRESAWEKLYGIAKRQQEFSIGVPAKNAMNLLCGRAVLDFPPHLVPERQDTGWIRFDLAKKKEDGYYPVIKIDGMSIREVDSHLSLLPVSTQDYYMVRASLLNGDLAPVTFSNGIKVLLEANPEHKALNIFSTDRKEIPFNFRFDPDWKPRPNQTPGIAQKQEEPKPKRNHFKITKSRTTKPSKGRGI